MARILRLGFTSSDSEESEFDHEFVQSLESDSESESVSVSDLDFFFVLVLFLDFILILALDLALDLDFLTGSSSDSVSESVSDFVSVSVSLSVVLSDFFFFRDFFCVVPFVVFFTGAFFFGIDFFLALASSTDDTESDRDKDTDAFLVCDFFLSVGVSISFFPRPIFFGLYVPSTNSTQSSGEIESERSVRIRDVCGYLQLTSFYEQPMERDELFLLRDLYRHSCKK